MKKAEFEFVVRHIVEEMVSYLMEDTGISLPEAFDRIYSTRLYSDLSNRNTHLYRYSPAYLYLKFQNESNDFADEKHGEGQRDCDIKREYKLAAEG